MAEAYAPRHVYNMLELHQFAQSAAKLSHFSNEKNLTLGLSTLLAKPWLRVRLQYTRLFSFDGKSNNSFLYMTKTLLKSFGLHLKLKKGFH